MEKFQALIERYFPCRFERGGALLVSIGVLSSLVYVFTRIGFKHELKDLPQNLMVITFLISAWGQRHSLKSDLVIKLLILALLIPWVLFGINALIDYESAVKYRSTNDLLKLCLFLPLAWWIGGSRRGVFGMLTIAFLGLVLAILMAPSLAGSIEKLFKGLRVDFGIHNEQHAALFFGMVILFCTGCLYQRFLTTRIPGKINALLVAIGLLGLIGLIGAKPRAAILGLFLAGFLALILMAVRGDLLKHLAGVKGILVLILALVVLLLPTTVLYNRIAFESQTIGAILSGDMETVPFSGSGIRIHSWLEALEWIAKRPITGWGQDARSDVIQLSERFPDLIKSWGFGHLHNGYLEILLGYGIVGLFYVAFLWITVLRRIRLAADRDIYNFALYSSIFFLVVNMFESFFIYWSGEFALALFLAGGYSQYLAKQQESVAGDSPRSD